MKNIFFLLFLSFISNACQPQKKIFDWGPFTINRTIIKVYENEKVKVLIADNHDIIEVFKDKSTQKCKKVFLGKNYKFRVRPVSDLIQGGIQVKHEYDLNDSVTIKYKSYFTFHELQNYCVQKGN